MSSASLQRRFVYDPQQTENLAHDRDYAARARIGANVAGFTLEDLLGVGGHSAVYAAVNEDGERVAVKVMHAGFAAQPGSRERLDREARVANALAKVGGVRVFEYGVERGTAFLVMELLEGETLAARASRDGGALGVAEVRRVGVALLGILAEAHARGFVHLDVKPENVFLTERGEVRMLDFGLAREDAAAEGAKSAVLLGTPAFMAPEQVGAVGWTTSVRTDVWGAGATLFNLLSGRYVHVARTPSEMLFMAGREPAPPLASVCPQAPPEMCRVIDRALRFQPEERWESVEEMRDALARSIGSAALRDRTRDAVAETLPEAGLLPPPASPARGIAMRIGLTALAGVTLLLALAVVCQGAG
jgi:serine/threonine-protein kinase